MNSKAREYGALAGMLSTIAAWSVNWLITPMSHPTASSARQTAVVVQLVLCLLLAAWFWRRAGREDPASTR
jgi:Na+/proline symporter